jgi:archaemetzincin
MTARADAVLLLSFLLAGCAAGGNDRAAAIKRAMERLRPLHTKLGEPKPGEWLYHHDEPGQTFQEYLAADPVGPTKGRKAVYIQPLGEFSPAQRKVVDLTAEFIGLYYNLPVTVKEALPLSVIPADARRTHPTWGVKQILSTYVLRKVLRPRLPDDAVASLAFTASDLWPGEGWNFVFGQASLRNRVGVWSIHRNGDPEAGAAEFRLCLLRTMKTGVHELGHMFSMRHCTAYECVMCGSNHRAEADRRPLAACPECAAKVWWVTGADPAERYRKLAAFCKTHGLAQQAAVYEKAFRAVTEP